MAYPFSIDQIRTVINSGSRLSLICLISYCVQVIEGSGCAPLLKLVYKIKGAATLYYNDDNKRMKSVLLAVDKVNQPSFQ